VKMHCYCQATMAILFSVL